MHIIIDFKNSVTNDEVQQYFTDNSCTVISTYSAFDKVYLVETASVPPVTDIIETVKNDEDTEIKPMAYPKDDGAQFANVSFSSTDANDWWKMTSVQLPNYTLSTQTYERRGQSAVIYVVDSGADLSHPEFEFASISNLWSFNNNFTDSNGHGTAVASLMCGKNLSIADPIVKVVKIFQADTSTRVSHFLGALDAVYNDLSNNTNKLSVVNMSWGITKDAYVEAKIKVLLEAGVIVICASGNSGEVIEDVTPASMPEVFTVGGYDESLKPWSGSNYSGALPTAQGDTNHGELDVWAPAPNIRVALPGGSYGVSSGTSFSAAIHSSAVAYNSHQLQTPSGQFPAIVLQDLFAAKISTGKKDMLNLSDPKYVNSKNLVTVFYAEPEGLNNISYPKPENFTVYAVSEQSLEKILAPNFMFAYINLADALPDGFRQEGLWIFGSKTVTEEFTFNTTATCVSPTGTQFSIPFVLKVITKEQANQMSMPTPFEDYLISKLEFYPLSIDKN